MLNSAKVGVVINMKKLLIILLIFFISGCAEKRDKSIQVYYFYNKGVEFRKSLTKDGISFAIVPGMYYIEDILGVNPIKARHIYFLNYFNGDTTFRKKKSYLDSIRYYDFKWLSVDLNLQDFWTKKRYGSSNRRDTLEIYLIEKIVSTDSVLFRRVQRKFSVINENE